MRIILIIVFGAMIVWGLTTSDEACAAEPTGYAAEPLSGYDDNTDHCVTPREVWLIGKALPRPKVERRWEMEGRGRRAETVLGKAWVYRMCNGDERLAVAAFRPGGVTIYGIMSPGLLYGYLR